MGDDYDVAGHLTGAVMDEREVPVDADFYSGVSPERFMHDIGAALAARGAAPTACAARSFGAGCDHPRGW